MATLAPSFASPSAIALPIPRLPPVTMAALPLRSRSMCAPTPVGLLGCNSRKGSAMLSTAPAAYAGRSRGRRARSGQATGLPAQLLQQRASSSSARPSNGLVAQGLFTAPHALEVVEQDVDDGILVALRLARRVRRNEHVRHGPKRRSGRQGFLA